MRLAALAGLALLAACAPMQGGTPERATLTPDSLTVTLSNGALCKAQRADGMPTPDGWAGDLAGCPAELSYRVRLQEGTNPVRFIVMELFESLGAEGLLSPLAEVAVTDAAGRVYLFQSPPRGR